MTTGTTEPRNNLIQGWPIGDQTYKPDMDANFKFLDNFGIHLSVKDRTLATPPATPANGDTHIIAASPTGAWATRTQGDVAMWSTADGAWRYATPRVGWVAYLEGEGKLAAFTASGWSAGVAL